MKSYIVEFERIFYPINPDLWRCLVACIVTEKYAGYNAVDIIIAHSDTNMVNPIFLAAFTNMPHGMNQIRKRTGGAAQQHFNVGAIKCYA